MQQYLNLLKHVIENGKRKGDYQKVGNIAVFSYKMRFNMEDGFPLITTKKTSLRNVAGELIWFLRGDSNVRWLQDRNIHIWDDWATAEACAKYGLAPGDLGMIYGPLWRRWPTTDGKTIDQIENACKALKEFPDSRRPVVSAWNPEFIDKVFVAPCHCFFQFFHAEGELSLHLTQRSADVFIGIPYNIASYSLLLLLMAKVTGLKPKEFTHELVDAHLYLNTVEQAKLQLTREPRPLPRIILPDIPDLTLETCNQLEPDDFKIQGYDPHPYIKAEVAI